MTQKPLTDLVPNDDEFKTKADALLTVPEYNLMMAYIGKGGHPLAPETAAKFFELFLNGYDCKEIHRLNKAFPYESILWGRIRFDWDRQRDEYAVLLQDQVRQKVIKAQLETTNLLTDVLVAANKKHGDKIKKFLQTGKEEDLGDAMAVDNISALLRAVDGLQKITGQSNTVNVNKKETLNVNVSASTGQQDGALSAETAAKILEVIAEEKRKGRGK